MLPNSWDVDRLPCSAREPKPVTLLAEIVPETV